VGVHPVHGNVELLLPFQRSQSIGGLLVSNVFIDIHANKDLFACIYPSLEERPEISLKLGLGVQSYCAILVLLSKVSTVLLGNRELSIVGFTRPVGCHYL